MKKKLIVLSSFALVLMFLVAPVGALAQTPTITTGGASTFGSNQTSTCQSPREGTIFTLLCRIGNILNAVVPVLIALGVVYFVYGVITYVISDDEEAKKTGRNRIIYGIIGLAVIVGVWGLVHILTNTFMIDNANNTITLPTI
jgi:hypothetical protein